MASGRRSDGPGRRLRSQSLKTSAALPPEMQALNALLEAQALVKKRQVSTQQSAQGGPGNNNRNYDISTLFDKELRRQQETRYETRPSSAEQQNGQNDALEKIAELARRQDELLKRQQELARQQLADAEMARQLEKLTREQSELRRQAEELAQRMSKLEAGQQNQSGPPTSSPSGGDQTTRQLREISDDMRNATGDLRAARFEAGRGQRQPGAREAQGARTAAAGRRGRSAARPAICSSKRDSSRIASGSSRPSWRTRPGPMP